MDSICTHCGTKIEPSSKFCPNCGRLDILATSGEGEGAKNSKGHWRRKSGRDDRKKKPSAWWYLLPIFLGFIGGIVMFFVLKDEDRGRAKGGLKLGIILTTIGFALWLIISYCGHSSFFNNFCLLLPLTEVANGASLDRKRYDSIIAIQKTAGEKILLKLVGY